MTRPDIRPGRVLGSGRADYETQGGDRGWVGPVVRLGKGYQWAERARQWLSNQPYGSGLVKVALSTVAGLRPACYVL